MLPLFKIIDEAALKAAPAELERNVILPPLLCIVLLDAKLIAPVDCTKIGEPLKVLVRF